MIIRCICFKCNKMFGKLLTTVKKHKNSIPVEDAEKYGWTPLQLLCFNSDYDQFMKCNHIYIYNSTVVEQQDIDGNTALHLLVRAYNDEDDSIAMLKLLLPHTTKASFAIRNSQSLTVLQEAVYYQSSNIVQLLNEMEKNKVVCSSPNYQLTVQQSNNLTFP